MGASTGTAATGRLWEHPRHERTHSGSLHMHEKCLPAERPLACTFPGVYKHTQRGMHWLSAGNQWDNPGECGGGDRHPSSVGRTGSTAQEMGWRSHPLGFGGGYVFLGGEKLSSFLQTCRSPLRCGIEQAMLVKHGVHSICAWKQVQQILGGTDTLCVLKETTGFWQARS